MYPLCSFSELTSTWIHCACFQIEPTVAKRLSQVKWKVEYTQHSGHASDLAREFVEAGYHTVVAVGGIYHLNPWRCLVKGTFSKTTRTIRPNTNGFFFFFRPGDGTISQVAHGYMLAGGNAKGCAIGIISTGTGGDFVRTTKTPKDPIAALVSIQDAADNKSSFHHPNMTMQVLTAPFHAGCIGAFAPPIFNPL